MKRASWAPTLTPGLYVRRALALFLVMFCSFGMFLSQPMAKVHALALSLIVSSLYGLILTALQYLPEEEGSVSSRGKRG